MAQLEQLNQKLMNYVKKLIKERNKKVQITGLRKKIIKELKGLIDRQTEKHKSYNIRRRVNRVGLEIIRKRQNLVNIKM